MKKKAGPDMEKINYVLAAFIVATGLALGGLALGGVYSLQALGSGETNSLTYKINRFTGNLEYCFMRLGILECRREGVRRPSYLDELEKIERELAEQNKAP